MASNVVKQPYTPLQWGEKFADTIMAKFEPEMLPPVGFHYHQGVFLLGMEKCWRQNQQDKYYQYIKSWVDSLVDEEGIVKICNTDNLDDIQSSILLFNLYEKSGDGRYKKALFNLIPLFKNWRTNEEGGFWHKKTNPNQMWLDGLFMAGPVAVKFGRTFHDPVYFDMMAFQAILMEKRTKDEKTGLLYHGWDPTKEAAWADPVTGRAPEFWGRAIGWYPIAILEMLDDLPADHQDRSKLIEILQNLLKSLVKFQDKSGLWYQVVDKGDRPDNWLETSCSSMFVYAIAKAVRMGHLSNEYLKFAWKGYEGIIQTLKFDENGGIIISDICTGTPIGDYAHYIARPRADNDLHGAGAFLFMCAEMNLANDRKI